MNFIAEYLKRSTQSIIKNRGAWLLNYGDFVRLDKLDRISHTARYIVKSESGRGAYTISIMNYDKSSLRTICTCPYEGICKHTVAALMHLENHLRFHPREYNPAHEQFPLQPYDIHFFISNTQFDRLEQGMRLLKAGKVFQKDIRNGEVNFLVRGTPDHEVTFKVDQNLLQTACSCHDSGSALCAHKAAALAMMVKSYGDQPFSALKDFSAERAAGLAQYGYKYTDPNVTELFDFEVKNGSMVVSPRDKSMVKLNKFQDWSSLTKKLSSPVLDFQSNLRQREDGIPILIYVFLFQREPLRSKTPQMASLQRGSGIAKDFSKTHFVELANYLSSQDNVVHPFPGFDIKPVRSAIRDGKLVGRLSVIDAEENNFRLKDIDAFETSDARLMHIATGIDSKNIGKTLEEITSQGVRVGGAINWEDLISEGEFDAAVDFVADSLGETIRLLKNKKTYEFIGEKFDTIKLKTIREIQIESRTALLEFDLDEVDGKFLFSPNIVVGDEKLPFGYLQRVNYWFLREGDRLFLLDKKAAKTLHFLENRTAITINKSEIEGFLSGFVLPLMNIHNVNFNIPLQFTDVEGIFNARLYLRESEDSLIFTPVFTYEYQGVKTEVPFDSRTRQIVTESPEKEVFLMYRDEEKEENIRRFFVYLHPEFESQGEQNRAGFVLTVQQLFENEWFFSAFEKINNHDIEVLGFNQLTKIRYNPNRAKINIRASSGIDWFDLEITIDFGEQNVSLKEVRRALQQNQHYVRLGDGTLGMLPKDWIEKYSSILKIGRLEGDKIRMSDRQFSLVEELYEEIDNHDVLRQLYEKKQKLRQFENIRQVQLPENISADLRDYQKSGFNWLNFLEDFGWGGILADDMGLGKTLQAITFIQHLVNRNPDSVNLVAVPKSLVFNWIKEIEKFAPALKTLAYYGPFRHQHKAELEKYQVVIATYGSIRSDIAELREIQFNYVILDESQSVKNPDALVSKSVKLLKARNRICMTGTPIENNTFDLYSQIDFLNPGMLGSVDFFKKEYANPIDRDKDERVVEQLRKLVYPFILRRTKEEVAKELPEKVETVIYCEMGAQQRKVYDSFKDRYRDFIMGKIDNEGLRNSGVYILEGLMKLRQICNSPELLTEKDNYGKESVKLEELIPRIAADSGRHKILIFSQFLDMLELIRKELEKLHIRYEYLDGQTKDRIERVENFQNNEECRVFLMSLKAGGVGLNLTAADYVYLVDPWWNPAVESQAIDRAHRIGQDKSVFAYKLICRDTIEEKILQLQERKKAVAKDLINIEAGFIKSLDREDVRDLFS